MKKTMISKLIEMANSLLSRFTSVLNQLPDPKTKIRQTPIFGQQQYAHAKTRRPAVNHSAIPNHSRDRKRKGPRHSSTMTYNHPRGDIRRI